MINQYLLNKTYTKHKLIKCVFNNRRHTIPCTNLRILKDTRQPLNVLNYDWATTNSYFTLNAIEKFILPL